MLVQKLAPRPHVRPGISERPTRGTLTVRVFAAPRACASVPLRCSRCPRSGASNAYCGEEPAQLVLADPSDTSKVRGILIQDLVHFGLHCVVRNAQLLQFIGAD